MRGLSAVEWLAVSCIALSGILGCAGSDEDVPAQFAEQCNGDCAEGLECQNRVCTMRCMQTTDCALLSPTAICETGYCFFPCTTSFNCPNGLACTQTQQATRMTCRAQP